MYQKHYFGIDVPAYRIVGFVTYAHVDAARHIRVLRGYVAGTFSHGGNGGFGVDESVLYVFEYDALVNGRDLIYGGVFGRGIDAGVFLRIVVTRRHRQRDQRYQQCQNQSFQPFIHRNLPGIDPRI